MAGNAVDPMEPPRVRDMLHWPAVDRAPAAPAPCAHHPEAHPRRLLRATHICPACVRERGRGG